VLPKNRGVRSVRNQWQVEISSGGPNVLERGVSECVHW